MTHQPVTQIGLLHFIDIAGTFVAAIQGAYTAAVKGLDSPGAPAISRSAVG